MTDPQEDDEPGAPIADFFNRYSFRREMALYYQSRRPIHALRAYYWIRQAGLPVPAWFLEWLDGVAERLTKTAPGNGDDVAEAFGMGATGRHTVECRRLEAAQMVAILIELHPGMPRQDIFRRVAKDLSARRSSRGQISFGFVKNAYYDWCPKK